VKLTPVGAFATPVKCRHSRIYTIFKVIDPTLVRLATVMGTLTVAPTAEGVTCTKCHCRGYAAIDAAIVIRNTTYSQHLYHLSPRTAMC